jgi:predicted RNase H-like nuclease (RuvC/YqgF family)
MVLQTAEQQATIEQQRHTIDQLKERIRNEEAECGKLERKLQDNDDAGAAGTSGHMSSSHNAPPPSNLMQRGNIGSKRRRTGR